MADVFIEKAAALMETDFSSVSILMTCYKVIGDVTGTLNAAQRVLARAEKITTQEPDNGLALGYVVMSLCTLGQAERAKDLAKRAMLLEPDNLTMRYNLSCGFAALGVSGSRPQYHPRAPALQGHAGKGRYPAHCGSPEITGFGNEQEHPLPVVRKGRRGSRALLCEDLSGQPCRRGLPRAG
jgi:hypothetical protein